jgi:fructokinase
VLFTDGANAVHELTSGRASEAVDVVLDVPRVPVVDTVGAGDSFSGGFLAHWVATGRTRADLGDLDAVVEAARYGIRVAGITCQRAGANPPFAQEVPSV